MSQVVLGKIKDSDRLRVAVQKSGRLTEKSVDLLKQCGVDIDIKKNHLFLSSSSFPLDIMLVRDDDIPELVYNGVCDLGIVGYNVLKEKSLKNAFEKELSCLKELGYGTCRLALAVPTGFEYSAVSDLEGLRIATSYPESMNEYLSSKNVNAKVVEINGSVELAPTLGISDVVCDLVSTGSTLKSNGLKEVQTIYTSQSLLIQSKKPLSKVAAQALERLLNRIDGVLNARSKKYIMMNAPKSSVEAIREILCSAEPSVMPLDAAGEKMAIHVACEEALFWETIEKLKDVGAYSILVSPIEKLIL